jgi:hypothetical protein
MLGTMPSGKPRILAVATATPSHYFPQSRLAELAGYRDAQRSGFFANSEIEGRYLYLDPAHVRTDESAQELNDRFQKGALELGRLVAPRPRLPGDHDVHGTALSQPGRSPDP